MPDEHSVYLKGFMVEIGRPDGESQYKLVPCKCGADKAEYAGAQGAIFARCPECGRKTKVYECAHDAQAEWNRTRRAHRKKR